MDVQSLSGLGPTLVVVGIGLFSMILAFIWIILPLIIWSKLDKMIKLAKDQNSILDRLLNEAQIRNGRAQG